MNALETTEFDDTLEPIDAEFDAAHSVLDFEDDESVAEEFENALPVPVRAPVRASDERANVPVTEVAERFLKAILAKVPLDRIEELHLFSPLRQGAVETGIAVVAARVILPPVVLAEMIQVDVMEASPDGDDSSPYADANVVALDEIIDQMIGEEIIAENLLPLESIEEESSEPPRVRHTVYTARYRLVIKGPERGRWEIDVVDEADAPLLTVETVVRGVQRRAGEETATVRYTAAQIARVLHVDTPVIQ